MSNQRWILDWQDIGGDDRRVLRSADSVDEFRADVERLLRSAEWTSPEAHGDDEVSPIPAYQAFQDEVLDLTDDSQILNLWESVSFECDDGTLYVVRER